MAGEHAHPEDLNGHRIASFCNIFVNPRDQHEIEGFSHVRGRMWKHHILCSRFSRAFGISSAKRALEGKILFPLMRRWQQLVFWPLTI
jgi:hypothetical protein